MKDNNYNSKLFSVIWVSALYLLSGKLWNKQKIRKNRDLIVVEATKKREYHKGTIFFIYVEMSGIEKEVAKFWANKVRPKLRQK